jgi:hypothetical protein
MMRIHVATVVLVVMVLGGCAARQPPAAEPPVLEEPGRIIGVVYLPKDQKVTPPMTIEVSVYNPHMLLLGWKQTKVLARQELKGVTRWPATFTMWTDWPGAKGSFYDDVQVFVRVAAPGQRGYVAERQRYTDGDSKYGRPAEFHLVPEVE